MRNRLNNTPRPRHLYGLALDHEDGHMRITQAQQFSVFGGSQETHEHLTMTFLRIFESLRRRGKRLEQTEPQELNDIIKEACE